MIKKRVIYLGIGIMLFSCSGNKEQNDDAGKPELESLLTAVKNMEDTLTKAMDMKDVKKKQIDLWVIDYNNRLLAVYQNYPESKNAPECLDKMHMNLSGIGSHQAAVSWADTILAKYPDYVNRDMVLQSAGSAYDAFITPRDSAKVRYYYSELLKSGTLDNETRKGLKKRLQFNHLSFDEYLDMLTSDVATK